MLVNLVNGGTLSKRINLRYDFLYFFRGREPLGTLVLVPCFFNRM